MSKRQPASILTVLWLALAAALGWMVSGCATTAEHDDRDLKGILESDPLSSTDPRNAAPDEYGGDESGGGILGSDGPTFDDLSLENAKKTWKKLTGRGPNRKLARRLYEQAEQIYESAAELPDGPDRAAKFVMASETFAEAAEYWPDSAVEMDALFMAGEASFFADHYWDATRFYERLIKGYPNNRYLDTVDARRFAIARYWVQLHEDNPENIFYANFINEQRPWRDVRGHALRQYDKIRIDDPTGRLADDATLAVANAHFKARRYLKADEYYTDLRKSYATSEHQFSAHYLGLKAKLESYLGPDYSGEALDEGEKLIKQMRRQFPTESEQEKEFLDRAAAEIRFRKAQKHQYFARYHDRRGEYRAAGRHYEELARYFDDTPFAAEAKERLTQFAGLPPVPPQKLPWLIGLFPASDEMQPILEAAKVPEGELPTIDDEGTVQQASGEE